jgi:5-bromo-4-chloroindolyl phosphate hydrolysis protein
MTNRIAEIVALLEKIDGLNINSKVRRYIGQGLNECRFILNDVIKNIEKGR